MSKLKPNRVKLYETDHSGWPQFSKYMVSSVCFQIVTSSESDFTRDRQYPKCQFSSQAIENEATWQ